MNETFCQICWHPSPGHQPDCPIFTGEAQRGWQELASQEPEGPVVHFDESGKVRIRQLDTKRVESVLMPIMQAIWAHYQVGPVARERVMECLNALAIAVATVCDGTEDPVAYEFFIDALNGNRNQ
jgi:hypothetical protein